MNHTQNHLEQQEAKRLQNRISSFLEDFKFGTLLNGSGIRKLRGAKPLAVFATIFSLPPWANICRGFAWARTCRKSFTGIKASILASVVVETKKDQNVKIVFVRHRHKRQWLAVLPTRIDLADEEIVRIYGKR